MRISQVEFTIELENNESKSDIPTTLKSLVDLYDSHMGPQL